MEAAAAGDEEAPQAAPTYEHACMRAELLGLPRPTLEEFEASRTTIRSANYDEDELEELQRQQEAAAASESELVEVQLTELDHQKEELRGAGGKLDELTNILALTQGKLNKFKTVCGSIKNLFKLRGEGLDGQSGDEAEDEAAPSRDPNAPGVPSPLAAASDDAAAPAAMSAKAKDLGAQLSSQNSALDRLLGKAETAEMSLSSQNKQIRSMLR